MTEPVLGRSARKRLTILSAGRQLFLSNGYQGTSGDQIAASAEVSKQTVYKHFGDKHELLLAIVATALESTVLPFLGRIKALADTSDLVVLAVKPRVLDEVAADLVQAGTPVLSILAGTTLETLHGALPGLDLTRVMPNLGAQLRQGVLCVVFPKEADEARRRRVTQLLGLVGEVVELDEDLIDTATAIMGCSPGYLALIAEILVELGVERGLTEEQTKRMVAKAMSATGGLLEVRDPGELKQLQRLL